MGYGNAPGQGGYGAPPPGQGGYGAPPPAGPGGAPPSNHLVWAILTTIFCCLPAGIVSIVFSTQVNSKYQAGDLQGAEDASNKAKTWAIVAAVAGVVGSILYIIFAVVLGIGGASTSTSTY